MTPKEAGSGSYLELPAVSPPFVLAEPREEPVHAHLLHPFGLALDDCALLVAVFAAEVLGGPLYVELFENSGNDKRIPAAPHLTKHLFCKLSMGERNDIVRGNRPFA